jgi:peptidyl-prolyl cis-trans isomerase D
MGDVTRDELDPAAAEAVFALDAPGVIGPFDTAFGPALYRMNGILAAQETPFEEVRDELRDELARDRARRVIRDQYDLYEDLLAGGATVEQLAEETEMQFGQIDFRPDTRSGIAAYEAFRDEAEAVGEGDFPVVRDLEDGGLFALRLDDVVPPRLQPFDEVVVRVIEGWEIAEIERRLSLRADEIVHALERGESFDELGIVADSFVGVTRNDFLPDVPRQVIAEAFEMQPGGHRVIAEGGVVLVVALDAVLPAETDTPEAEQLIGAIDEQLRQSIAQDLFTYYARRLEAEAGIRLDERAIQAVHQNFR